MITEWLSSVPLANVDSDSLDRIERIVENALSVRSELFRSFLDPRRDVDDECGFPKGYVAPESYWDMYNRNPIAARVVEVLPLEVYQVQPLVYERKDDEITPFEDGWDSLGNTLAEEESYHAEEQGSSVFDHLLCWEVMSRVASYGVLLLGLDDGKDLSQPAEHREGQRLTFLRAFPEHLAQVDRVDDDRKSKRYGRPVEYNITFWDSKDVPTRGAGTNYTTQKVHYSRVLHQTNGPTYNAIYGPSAQKHVLRNLLTLDKLYGASGEGYWKSCFAALSFETHPQLGGNVRVNVPKLKDMVENFHNGLQRALYTMGMSVKSLAPSVVDPGPFIDRHIEAVCIKLAVPKRVFMGSERGELASAQDDDNWSDRRKGYQKNHSTPRTVVPFVNRLVNLGVLPEPEQFFVEWPELGELSPSTKSQVLTARTNAYATYIEKLSSVIPMKTYMTEFDGMSEETADAIESEVRAAQSANPQAEPEEDGAVAAGA